ncbi:hypothetical protein ACFVTZ_01665 [Cellulosimicrobium cellulans]|uniref:hypothetical protein n=1 Tax=Cellulosimicrobium cellulans TaxID=1710 RepID=UPI0036DFD434
MSLLVAEHALHAAQRAADVEQADVATGATRLVAAVSARLVYTRLWVRADERWLVLAATLAPAAETA